MVEESTIYCGFMSSVLSNCELPLRNHIFKHVPIFASDKSLAHLHHMDAVGSTEGVVEQER
jgi:hypothetical protein